MGAVFLVAGCGVMRESRLNPFNWFGRGEPRETVQAATPQDARLLVEQGIAEQRLRSVTGNADPLAPHLHFAVFVLGPEKHWWKGTAINPYPLFAR